MSFITINMHIFTLRLIHCFCTVREDGSGSLQRVNCNGYTLKKAVEQKVTRLSPWAKLYCSTVKGTLQTPIYSVTVRVQQSIHLWREKLLSQWKWLAASQLFFFAPNQHNYNVNPSWCKHHLSAVILHLGCVVKRHCWLAETHVTFTQGWRMYM